MKTEVEVEITTKVDQTVKAMDKVTCAAKQLQAAIEKLNDTGITIQVNRINKQKLWYQFWK